MASPQNIKHSEQPIKSVRQLLFDNLLSVGELAADLGFAHVTIYQWIRQGVPHRKIRGRLFFDAAEVAEWMKRTTEA